MPELRKLVVRELADGRWAVVEISAIGETVLQQCATNAAAWRECERLDRRPTWKTAKRHFWGR